MIHILERFPGVQKELRDIWMIRQARGVLTIAESDVHSIDQLLELQVRYSKDRQHKLDIIEQQIQTAVSLLSVGSSNATQASGDGIA